MSKIDFTKPVYQKFICFKVQSIDIVPLIDFFGFIKIFGLPWSISYTIWFSDFRSSLLDAIGGFHQNKDGGMFINSCNAHCQTFMAESWHSPTSVRIKNKVTRTINAICCLLFLSISSSRWTDSVRVYSFIVLGTDNCRVCRWLVLQSKTSEANRLCLPMQYLLLNMDFTWK